MDDIRISQFIVEQGFSQEFKSSELKGGCHETMDLIKDQYNMFYKEIFLKQMITVLNRLEKEYDENREKMLKAVKESACFILKKKKMSP